MCHAAQADQHVAQGAEGVRCAAIVITTNATYKQWLHVFNNDSTIATAIHDRLVHHCETITIEGKSYRMKDKA